jgi:hypothetical protein
MLGEGTHPVRGPVVEAVRVVDDQRRTGPRSRRGRDGGRGPAHDLDTRRGVGALDAVQ